MALMSYKCPNCGGGLVFDPDSQKFQCEYCLSEFTEEEMKRMEEVSASPAEEGEAVLEEEGTAPQEGDSSQGPETGEAAVYTCPSCGAQIVTDATTAASFCYYCHNPVVFSGRLSGDHMRTLSSPLPLIKRRPHPAFKLDRKKEVCAGGFFLQGHRSKSCRGSTSLIYIQLPGGRPGRGGSGRTAHLGLRQAPGTQSIKSTRWNGRAHWKLKI